MSAEKFKKKKAKTGEKKQKQKLAEKSVFAVQKPKEETIPVLPGKLNICVMGSEAIGGLIAAYLRNKLRKISVVGTPEQVRALRMHGLRVEGVKGTIFVDVVAKEKIDEKVDVVVLAVKTQDIQETIDANRPYLNDTLILTTQNGIRAEKIIARALGENNIIASIIMFGASYLKLGSINHNFEGNWIIGRAFGPNDEKVKELAEEFAPAFNTEVVDNIIAMKWMQLLIATTYCIPVLLGKCIGEAFADLTMAQVGVLLLKECCMVVDDAGIQLANVVHWKIDALHRLTTLPIKDAAKMFSEKMGALGDQPDDILMRDSIQRLDFSYMENINGEIIRLSRFGRVGAQLNTRAVNLTNKVKKKNAFLTQEEIAQAFHEELAAN